MEEIEYKLGSNNPILIFNAVRILVKKIKQYSNGSDKYQFEKHLKFLREKCLDENVCVCSTAVNGLISLAEEDVDICTVDALLTEFLAALPNAQNLNGIIQLVFHVLLETDVNYGIMNNQHPVISILKRQPSIWPTLLTYIHSMIQAEGRNNTIKKLQPFVIFALCNQECHEYQMFQMELLKLFHKSLDLVSLNKIIMFSKPNLHRSVQYCDRLIDTNPLIRSSLINCTYELFSNNMDASQAVSMLSHHMLNSSTNNSECELLLLADCIYVCPYVHIETILSICAYLLNSYTNSHVVAYKIKSALINWKIQFTVHNAQSASINDRINKILNLKTTISNMTCDIPPIYLLFNEKIYLAFELLKRAMDDKGILDKMISAPIELNVSIFNHVLGILYGSVETDVIKKSLAVLINCTNENPHLTSKLLPIILYKLANSISPQVNLDLLRSITKMAVLKENIAVVVTTLKAISKYSSDMHTLSISLFYDLINVNPSCFVYLQEIFADSKENYEEHNIAKAFILKEMCAKNFNLEVYGTELTSYLSKILNGSMTKNNTLPQALAFQGLKYLCRHDIIDVSTAWYSLAPRYENDGRGLVIKSLCELMAEAVNASVPGPTHDKFVEEVTKKLWSYTIEYDDPIILEAAYKAMGQFDLEQVSSTMIEEYMVDNSTMLFGNISGTCWINVLLKGNKTGLPYAAEMLRSLIAAELRNYRKGTYEVHQGTGEPPFMNLPAYSILAGVASYVKKNVSTWQTNNPDVYLQCLRILSIKYLKPLPPMDWCFLQELIHIPETRLYTISLATHQVILSGSARNLMDNYLLVLADVTAVLPEVVHMYSVLRHLCNSIQPTVIKPFITNTLKLALTDFRENKNNAEANLLIIIEELANILSDVHIQDVNKSIIAQIVVNVMENLEYNQPVFNMFLKCANALPEKHLNDLSCPKLFDSLNETMMKKLLTIRCSVAINQTACPLLLLDSFINLPVISKKVMEDMPFADLFKLLKPVFVKHGRSDQCCWWLTELMAKIQLQLADSREIHTVVFNCMVFIISVCVASGYYVFKDDAQTFSEFSECFPYALTSLLQTKHYSSIAGQMLEWLHDICANKSYKYSSSKSETVICTLRAGLLSNRNTDAFKDQFKWMKYVEVVAK